jgi:hypothetical protein
MFKNMFTDRPKVADFWIEAHMAQSHHHHHRRRLQGVGLLVSYINPRSHLLGLLGSRLPIGSYY